MTTDDRAAIFATWQAHDPNPTTELSYQSHFELLIAVVLSAQATDVSVNKATQPLFQVANTPAQIHALGEQRLRTYIKTIGLYRTKAKHIIQLCAQLLEHHQGQVPATRAELEALPGVGRKTANVVLNTAFGQPTLAVDTHIFRVANRTGLASGRTPLAVEQGLLTNIPVQYHQHAHHWMILHGRYTCTARKPRCGSCAIKSWCEFKEKV